MFFIFVWRVPTGPAMCRHAVSTHWNGSAKICAIGIATRLQAGQPRSNRGSISSRDEIGFFPSNRPDGLCGSPGFLFSGYWRHFLRGVKLTTHLHLASGYGRLELYLLLPACFRGVYRNKYDKYKYKFTMSRRLRNYKR